MSMSADRKISIVLLALASFYLWLAFRLPAFAAAGMDADVVPKFLGFLLIGLAAILFLQNKPETEESLERRRIPVRDLGLLAGILVGMVLYAFLMERLGFVLTTLPFLLIVSWVLGYRNLKLSALVSAIFIGVTYYSFNYLLNINLPQGILPF